MAKQQYKELYNSLKYTRAHTREKTSTMLNEIESLKAQLKSKVSCVTSDSVKPKVLAPGMYAIDVKPIPHPLKNNRRVNTSTEASGSRRREAITRKIDPAAKSEKKKKVEDHPRTNKYRWIKVNRVDSALAFKRVIINSNSKSCRPLVSGLRLFKTYDGESFKAQELCGKVSLPRHSCFVRENEWSSNLLKVLYTKLYTILIDNMIENLSPYACCPKASKNQIMAVGDKKPDIGTSSLAECMLVSDLRTYYKYDKRAGKREVKEQI
ncbi:hypothetical protein Tco_1419882 [Tanacetum coccineum]